MDERIQHFSHEHLLSFFEADDDEDRMPHLCSICGLPILSSPSYTCSIDANCNFFLHKPCAQLPKELYHQGHLDTLYLEQPNLPPSDGESRKNFTYKCRNYSRCKFDLHPLVAKPVEIKSQHVSHKSHPLAAFCRKTVSQCDGCGEEQKGFFFNCQECNFWIHQDCTILPSIVKIPSHPHPYFLSYSPPYTPAHSLTSDKYLYARSCSICRGTWRRPNGGVYFCGECLSLAHVTCVKSSMENLKTENFGTMTINGMPAKGVGPTFREIEPDSSKISQDLSEIEKKVQNLVSLQSCQIQTQMEMMVEHQKEILNILRDVQKRVTALESKSCTSRRVGIRFT